jgi:cytochrome c peroxidase
MLSERETDGYRVNDLRGLWATAPYLHNGSVETLEELFTPAANRQTSWMHDNFLVDTTIPGNGAQGHEFGTTLSDTDKAALIAYLNSL